MRKLLNKTASERGLMTSDGAMPRFPLQHSRQRDVGTTCVFAIRFLCGSTGYCEVYVQLGQKSIAMVLPSYVESPLPLAGHTILTYLAFDVIMVSFIVSGPRVESLAVQKHLRLYLVYKEINLCTYVTVLLPFEGILHESTTKR